jgi:predicted  nucleic acid-binding Zn-ribbon protein
MADSPAFDLEFSPREDYSKCVAEYEDNSEKCSKRCGTYFSCDKKYKDLQLELFELLTLGDEEWEKIQTCGKGSAAQRMHIETLQNSVEQMYANLARQEDSIKEVEVAMKKAVRQLEKTVVNIDGLMEQVAAVRKNLADRVGHMTKLEPALMRKRSPKELPSSSGRKRAASPRRDKDSGRESRRGAGTEGGGYPTSSRAR